MAKTNVKVNQKGHRQLGRGWLGKKFAAQGGELRVLEGNDIRKYGH